MIRNNKIDYDGKKYNYSYVRNNENIDYDLDANNDSYAIYNDDYDDIYDNGINNSCTSNGKATTPRITNLVLYYQIHNQINRSLIPKPPIRNQMNYSFIIKSS